jgi:arabinose-5-phosphate isomerase
MILLNKRKYLRNLIKYFEMEQYTSQIINATDTINETILDITKILNPLLLNNTVYITGIGKSSHIARKCVSTWQSLGIKAQNILIQDMMHGDMGILQKGDCIIYISNSGNTEELINIAKYISNTFNIVQISLTANLYSKLKEFCNYSFIISKTKIKEDIPTVSSVIFMIALDQLGIKLSNITNNQFKLSHPSGNLKLSFSK